MKNTLGRLGIFLAMIFLGVAPAASQTVEEDLAIQWLRAGRYAELDAWINGLQADYEQDTNREQDLGDALGRQIVPDPSLEPHIQAWRAQFPDSYAAQLVAGAYFKAMGWAWRGNKAFQDIHPERLERMESCLNQAREALERSLQLTGKPCLSYANLMQVAAPMGENETLPDLLGAAMKADPYCIAVRDSFHNFLGRNWGGSLEAKRTFAEETARIDHPKARRAAAYYRSTLPLHYGSLAEDKRDYIAALKHFNQAIALAETPDALLYRADIYLKIGQTGQGMADIQRAYEINPHYQETLVQRAWALRNLQQYEAHAADLRAAALRGNAWAMRRLGDLHFKGGEGVAQDIQASLYWWGRAAYFWDEQASHALGKLYEQGHVVPRDFAAAVRHYRIAAEQGHAAALNDLGLLLWYGRGAPQDQDAAVDLWMQAADQDVWQARHNLNFFLTPRDRLRLMPRYPGLFWESPRLVAQVAGGLVVLLLTFVLLGLIIWRRGEARRRVWLDERDRTGS